MLVSLALSPAQAGQPQGIRVHMHGAEGYAADGMLYTPKGEPPFASIVLIPDERGITTRLTEAVSRFSERGFLVVELDLNRGLAPAAASHSQAEAVHDLDATLSFVAAQASVRHNAVGLMGWQSGGDFAMKFAADPRVKAVIIVDVLPLPTLTEDSAAHTPILAAFAGRDARLTTQSLASFEAQAKRHGFRLTVKRYREADAEFDDPDSSANFRPAQALDFGKRQVSFFSEHLRP